MDVKLPPKGSQCIPGPASVLFKDKDTYPSSKHFKNCRVRQLCKFREKQKTHPFREAFRICNAICFEVMNKTKHLGFGLRKIGDLVPNLQDCVLI